MTGKVERVFYCIGNGHDKHVWPSLEYVEDAESEQIMANCPICSTPCNEVHKRFLNLQKAWANATGPRTERGKARAKLNNFKTCAHSKSYPILAPAIPGKFPACTGCEFRSPCESEPYTWCPVLIQPMIEFMKAYQEGRLEALKEFAGLNQARAFQIVQMMFMEIQRHGVLVEEVEETKLGMRTQFKANPLLNRIPEYIQLLGFNAEQQSMTPRQEQEDENVRGFLDSENAKSANLAEYIESQRMSMFDLQQQIRKANFQASQDTALKRYTKQLTSGDQADEKPIDQGS